MKTQHRKVTYCSKDRQHTAEVLIVVLQDYPHIEISGCMEPIYGDPLCQTNYLEQVLEKAASIGPEAVKALYTAFDRMGSYCNDRSSIVCLCRDFAPLSFAFTRRVETEDGMYAPYYSGGLIYSGPSLPSDGSYPSLTVSLDPDASSGCKPMWSVHT